MASRVQFVQVADGFILPIQKSPQQSLWNKMDACCWCVGSMNRFRGLWTLPAGFVDAGEDPARAAERECLEETSLTVRVTRVMDVIAGREHPRGADFIIVYAAQFISGIPQAGDDADQVGWFERSNLPPLAFRATQKVLSENEIK